jgi:hypothetical protein
MPARRLHAWSLTANPQQTALEADEKLRKAIEGQRAFYPKEYGDPVHPDESGGSSIVGRTP